jgi:hypothetical protein
VLDTPCQDVSRLRKQIRENRYRTMAVIITHNRSVVIAFAQGPIIYPYEFGILIHLDRGSSDNSQKTIGAGCQAQLPGQFAAYYSARGKTYRCQGYFCSGGLSGIRLDKNGKTLRKYFSFTVRRITENLRTPNLPCRHCQNGNQRFYVGVSL